MDTEFRRCLERLKRKRYLHAYLQGTTVFFLNYLQDYVKPQKSDKRWPANLVAPGFDSR